MNGTSAYVEIRERTDAEKLRRVLPYANIISADDAIIVDIEPFQALILMKFPKVPKISQKNQYTIIVLLSNLSELNPFDSPPRIL